MRIIKPFSEVGEVATGATTIKPLLRRAALFGGCMNFLALTGPMFMLFIYDRVLSSGSLEALAVFSLLAFVLFICFGVLDYSRNRTYGSAGHAFYALLRQRVFTTSLIVHAQETRAALPRNILNDLETLRQFISSGMCHALFDLPWSLFFLGFLYFLHPWIGHLAAFGALTIFGVTVASHRQIVARSQAASKARHQSERTATEFHSKAAEIVGQGIGENCYQKWAERDATAANTYAAGAEIAAILKSWNLSIRQILQSSALALGAYLVLQHQVTAGTMIAASILVGRVIAPIEAAVNGWQHFIAAQKSSENLTQVLSNFPQRPSARHIPLASPLTIENLTVYRNPNAPPSLSNISFTAEPGEVLGIVGPSGSGKSTLAKALAGLLTPSAGHIRIGDTLLTGANAPNHPSGIGYLAQSPCLLTGSIAENISKFVQNATPSKIIAAAKLAGIHDRISNLPRGYDTLISGLKPPLSYGEQQQLCIARALFDNPEIIVLDEPDTHLNLSGVNTLNASIRKLRQANKIILIMSDRPSALAECDKFLVLRNGLCIDSRGRAELLEKLSVHPPKKAEAT